MQRTLFLLAVTFVVLGVAAPSAAGGGSSMESPKDSHEPGDEVTVVGYTGPPGPWVGKGPWIGALDTTPFDPNGGGQSTPRETLEVGEALVVRTRLGGYLSYRVSLTFTLPDDLEAGIYNVRIRNADGALPGDIVGAFIPVGMPAGEGTRYLGWPLDEPLITELPDDTVIAGPEFSVTAAELRRGQYPPDAAEFMLDPSALPPAATTSSTSTTSSATSTTTSVTTTTVMAQAASDPDVDAALEVLSDADAVAAATSHRASANRAPDVPALESTTQPWWWLLGGIPIGGAAAWLVQRGRRRHRTSAPV